MTDRELLELAAKAAGIEGEYDAKYEEFIAPKLGLWSPLTNDGDALRLAVKLRLLITFDDWSDGETVIVSKGKMLEAENIVEADPYAATRRAIVRAAAEIGKEST